MQSTLVFVLQINMALLVSSEFYWVCIYIYIYIIFYKLFHKIGCWMGHLIVVHYIYLVQSNICDLSAYIDKLQVLFKQNRRKCNR